jgi:hypothetical protein
MGIHRKNGYSASVSAILVVKGNRFAVAKTSDVKLVVGEPCELPPGCEAELVVTVDGRRSSRTVILEEGIARGQLEARYTLAAPF